GPAGASPQPASDRQAIEERPVDSTEATQGDAIEAREPANPPPAEPATADAAGTPADTAEPSARPSGEAGPETRSPDGLPRQRRLRLRQRRRLPANWRCPPSR